MALMQLVFFPGPHLAPDHAAYWLLMQIGMILGFLTAYPVNVWVIRSGIKGANVIRTVSSSAGHAETLSRALDAARRRAQVGAGCRRSGFHGLVEVSAELAARRGWQPVSVVVSAAGS
jgi:Domain of unknown function (DUF4396)